MTNRENGEARDAVAAVPGFNAVGDSERANSVAPGNSLQVVGERMDNFQRLERSFSAVGWNLYPLHGESFLAVHRAWQTSTVCHSLGQAAALLRRVLRGA